ncbi:unnamed protein product [Durusdinium trenchii]|uniref:Uncharacterized protein n=1 Tax=Durusdinium trenchii TaxID=1381693 RepID=A0ABP0PAT6_9DINO
MYRARGGKAPGKARLSFAEVWSKFLAFLCFLNATLLLGEESFYSFMSQLPSSSSCLLNHRVGYCDANGINLFHESVRVQVVLSPVESQSLQLESPSLWTLSLVLVVAFANSRYVTKLQAFLVWPLALLGLLLCSVHAARTLVDLGNCRAISEHHPVTWLAAAPLGNRSAPSAAAERVAEYCWVPPLPNLHGPSAARAGAMVEKEPVADFLSRQGIDINMTLLIRDVWITWMESATFSFRFENHTKVSSYCEVLQMPTMSHCLRWMNSSELGNSISCHGPSLDDVLALQASGAELESLAEAGRSPHLSDRQRLQQLLRISESWQLKLLQSRGCRARISGQNFALRPPSLGEDVPGGEKALERHLLLLAQHMWETEVLDDLLHLHYKVPGVSVAARPSAVELHGTQESYLQPSFVGCVARIFHGCAERVASATLTHFRSLCQATCALLMFLGYVRMLAIRIGCFRWCREHWPSPEPDSTRLYHFYQCMQRLKERVQQALGFLNTRVGVGLLMASLLQVGFTVLANELAMGWISEGNGVRMAEWMKLYPLSMIDGLMILSIWLQLAVFLLAVCYNCILHVHLRSQILALPRHVLFGPERVIPESYQGPDLNELKRMGKTSLVYAMYFPGIVFWHFFYASWILVLVFSFALGCLILVGQPGEVRSVHAQRIWPVLTYGAFLGTVLLAHFVTRLFTQRCLLHQHGQGIRIRCLCLFTWYEVMLFLLSFAVGPTAALWDYLKGFICTVLASLVIQKPNFTQFGELSDYVYCTYCAALLLERMDRDRKDDSPRHRQHEAELHSCQDLQQNCDRWDSKDEPSLLDSSYESKVACLRRTVVFWLLFLGVPLAAAATVGRASYVLGYSCPKFLKAVLPFSKCASEMKKDVCCPWRWAEFYCWAGQVFWGRIHRGGEGASRGRTRVIPVPWPGITRAAPSRQAVSPEPPSRQAVPEEMTSHVTSPDSIDWRKLRRPP